MADAATLRQIIEALEKAGTPPSGGFRDLDVAIACACPRNAPCRPSTAPGKIVVTYPSGRTGVQNAPNFTFSLDAAVALAECVLPGQWWELLRDSLSGSRWYAFRQPNGQKILPVIFLLATLRALLAKGAAP